MILFPNAKINLGLNVTERRADGYHNLETLFYPTGLSDILEVLPSDRFSFSTSGIAVDGDPEQNLVVKAYRMVEADFPLPPVAIHLHKLIPHGAGLGGGSSDGAFMLQLLNHQFKLSIAPQNLTFYASRLGADCSFFIYNRPALAEGIGDLLSPSEITLTGWHLVVVKPPFGVSTAGAFQQMIPRKWQVPLAEVLKKPVEEWRGMLHNDFEPVIDERYPSIAKIRQTLYTSGAVYAAMSGSGSAVFGLFKEVPAELSSLFPSDHFYFHEECKY